MTYYTKRDPRWEVICQECRYGEHKCAVRIVITGSKFIDDGTYRCGCSQCR
jgi:hypothetical protein